MERYTLGYISSSEDNPYTAFATDLNSQIQTPMVMGVMSKSDISEVINFIAYTIYGYFYNDLIAYPLDPDYIIEDYHSIFLHRLCYDISVKLPYWYRKYYEIKNALNNPSKRFCLIMVLTLFLGVGRHTAQLVGSQFSDQGLNLGLGSESHES